MVNGCFVLNEGAVAGWTDVDRETVLNLLNEILAIEIVCVLRYKRQESMAKEVHAGSLAAEFQKLAQDAQVHVDLVAERITQLEGEPNFTPVGHLMENHSEYIEGSSFREMIKGDWVAERMAIDFYREMIRVINGKDPTTHRMLENIVASEKKHTARLIHLMTSFEQRTITSYFHSNRSFIASNQR